jgi:diacylglycerol kinase family enzyme
MWAFEVVNGLLLVVLICAGLLVASLAAARAALRPPAPTRPVERPAPAPTRPFVIMNPRSGGGKVDRLGLRDRAEALGAEVALLEGPGIVDVTELARRAVADGADLLGVAGGDGTQALVAGVAAEAGVPLVVIPAGTRNHFALDLGLDRDDCVSCLGALVDGVDIRVDLGDVAGRPFVNNVSFGAYAAVVARPGYRESKVRVVLDALPGVLSGDDVPPLTVHVAGTTFTHPQATLVSNNQYGTHGLTVLGRRPRLHDGVLGVLVFRVDGAREAVRLLRGRRTDGVQNLLASEVVVDCDTAEVAAGIDGESVMLPTPVHCRVRPGVLRVRVPRDRPGPVADQLPISFRSLMTLAAPHGPDAPRPSAER